MMKRAVNTALDDICGEIGFTATLALVAWFGHSGSNVFVPKVAHEGQLLVALLGIKAADKLSQTWGGEHLTVPSMSVYENMVRKRFIGRLLESGFSWGETALRMDMSERRVQQIAQELQGQGLIQELAPKKRGRKSAQEMGAKTPSKNGGQKTGVSCAHVTSTLAAPTGLGKITKHPRSPTLPVGGRPRKKRVEIQSAD